MDKEQRQDYMADYNRMYKSRNETAYLEDKYLWSGGKHKNSELVIQPTRINFQGSDSDEPRFCNVFGCGRQLSLEELRFGNKCICHG